MMSTNGGPAVPELFQFAFSHYNEKARWVLDWKGVAPIADVRSCPARIDR